MSDPTPLDTHHYIAAQSDEITRLTQDRIALSALVRQLEAEIETLRRANVESTAEE